MNHLTYFEDRASRSRGTYAGESSPGLCDRLSRTRDFSQRQLPTDHDYAVPTREYQTDQSSFNSAPAVAGPVLDRPKPQRQKTPHRCAGVDKVTPYQPLRSPSAARIDSFSEIAKIKPHAPTETWGFPSLCHLLTGVGHMPHRAASVVGDKQRAVIRHRDTNRTPPHLTICCNKAGKEVVVLAGGFAVLHRDVDHLIARAVLAIPTPMLGGKRVALEARRKLLLLRRIENHFQRGHVRLHQHVRCNHLG